MSGLLATRMVEKPWGKPDLPAPFTAPAGKKIGEVWFEPPPALPELLVKYIFTSEALSVQVHPSDAQTQAKGLGNQGKTECWLIVSAEPGAKIGIGFDYALSGEQLRAAALDGSIEHLLTWFDAQPGDFFYIPANTVHAIGAGIGLIETQQNSDITYRLYDYGRPRELHLDDSIAVADRVPYPAENHRLIPARGAQTLVDGPMFQLDRYDGPLSAETAARYAGATLLVIPQGAGTRVGDLAVAAGQCALVDDIAALDLAPGALGLIAQPLVRNR